MNITDPKSKYILYVGYEFEVEGNLQSLMQKAIPITNYKSGRIHSYHSKVDDTSKGLWRVERDASLYNGAEFISPPMPVEDSFKMMREFFQNVIDVKSSTSIRCGCHTNICLTYNGKILKINENAIVCNIDWRLLCSLWPDRLKNKNVYCKYISHILKENDSFLKLKNKREFAKNLFNYYHGFITRKPSKWNKEGIYYELRFPGGADYHLHPEKIETTVRHFNEVLDKSRLAVCRTQNKIHNKKIISYINRKSGCDINIPFFNGLLDSNIKNVGKLKNIKSLINTSNKNLIYKLLLGMVFDIIYIKRSTSNRPFYRKTNVNKWKNFAIKMIKTINKENVIYYIYKFCYIYAYGTGNPITTMIDSVKTLLQIDGIKFTIPKEERDLHKLWLVNYLDKLPKQYEHVLVESITNNRIKILLNKLVQNKRYLEPKFCKFINHMSTEHSNNDTRYISR